ncbi:uncharacterized protein LOC114243926 [Bombyx mandarina]|uniref:N-acetylneuraminate lyase n=1 Tax=Bombyx mandarina TaxID=7092 RepID=A0A6J2JP78_BOMMA|nr:uncharacterized protein LOC114243926 [Bombyx mandarina]
MYSISGLTFLCVLIINVFNTRCEDYAEFNQKGVFATVFTPFNDDGSVNYKVIPKIATYLKYNGIDGVVVADTPGEGPNLNLCETKKLLDSWTTAGRPLGLKVVAQIGGSALPVIISLAKYAANLQVDALLVLPTPYYKPEDALQLVSLLELVAKAAPSLPIIYNDSHLSGLNVDMVSFFKLASERIPQFKGLKTKLEVALNVKSSNNLRENQNIYISDYLSISSALQAGFDTFFDVTASVYPELILEIIKSCKNSDDTAANEAQQKLSHLTNKIIAKGGVIPGLKAAAEIVTGYKFGDPRQPLQPVSQEDKNDIKTILEENGCRISAF